MTRALALGHHQPGFGFALGFVAPALIGQPWVKKQHAQAQGWDGDHKHNKPSTGKAVDPKVDGAKQDRPQPGQSGAFIQVALEKGNVLAVLLRFFQKGFGGLVCHNVKPLTKLGGRILPLLSWIERKISRVLPGTFATRVIRALFCGIFLVSEKHVGCGCCCGLGGGYV